MGESDVTFAPIACTSYYSNNNTRRGYSAARLGPSAMQISLHQCTRTCTHGREKYRRENFESHQTSSILIVKLFQGRRLIDYYDFALFLSSELPGSAFFFVFFSFKFKKRVGEKWRKRPNEIAPAIDQTS
jgi:hypothetical protein